VNRTARGAKLPPMSFLPPTPRDRPQRRLGLTDDELATAETVYRDGILDGQVFLIPGGGSGIGRATAYLAARLGAEVMICGRREAMLRETAEGIAKRLGREVGWKAMSIREPDKVAELVDETWARFGRIDTLVNSAGGQFIQPSMDYSPKGWLAVIDTNLNGHWWLMQACGRKWRDNDHPGTTSMSGGGSTDTYGNNPNDRYRGSGNVGVGMDHDSGTSGNVNGAYNGTNGNTTGGSSSGLNRTGNDTGTGTGTSGTGAGTIDNGGTRTGGTGQGASGVGGSTGGTSGGR